jgi:hypothetical protein
MMRFSEILISSSSHGGATVAMRGRRTSDPGNSRSPTYFVGSLVAVQPISCAVWMLPFDSLNRKHNEPDGFEEVIVIPMLYADLCKKGASSLTPSLAKLAALPLHEKSRGLNRNCPVPEPGALSPTPAAET